MILEGKQFEARWLQEELVMEIVHTAWERTKLAGAGPTLASRTRAVHAYLHQWDKHVLRGPKRHLTK